MNYKAIYEILIAKRQVQPAIGLTETHHIVPRSLGGNDDASNLVVLTCREHLLAHKLLTRFCKPRGPLLHALRMMLLTRKSSRGYEADKIQLKIIQLSPEYREHLSSAMQNPDVKKRKSEAAKRAWQNPEKREAFLKNRILTPEMLAQRSLSQKAAWQNDERRASLVSRNVNLSQEARAAKSRSMKEAWKVKKHPAIGKKWYNDSVKSYLTHPEKAERLGLKLGRLSPGVMTPDKK